MDLLKIPKQNIPNVSELTQRIKAHLEQHFININVLGELSNVKKSSNGHIYCILKDSDAQLPCVMWRNQAQRYASLFSDGKEVILRGSIQVYKPQGKYQFIIEEMEAVGVGNLQIEFERLKKKLTTEGLFDASHKKPLPRIPTKIGVVSSRTTAAFQDIISTLSNRWPLAEISLYHASVQGARAAGEICQALEFLGKSNDLQVIIIARGGGSLEDLWPFNEESVARTIHSCPIPIISGIGHEIDFSLSDFVADQRAATPTQAAVLATPNRDDVLASLDECAERLHGRLEQRWNQAKQRVDYLTKSYALKKVQERLQISAMRVRNNRQSIEHHLSQLTQQNKTNFIKLEHRLKRMNPNEALEKGYTRVWQNGQWIRHLEALNLESFVEIEFKQGRKRFNP
ncbi:MAG: exodeoxyribonuclease VII large subunit [Balneola sp.]|nr:exodeoxyribonuclease VII large subunit [Balneola sp.]|tara:strand:+ start:1281 stop:2477 length:1197 start_codon:yes stop_codon:yes gene_type:complete